MAFKYKSGWEVRQGDRVLYAGTPARVAFVVTDINAHPALNWFLQHFPGGGLLVTINTGVSIFLQSAANNNDLEFVSRHPK